MAWFSKNSVATPPGPNSGIPVVEGPPPTLLLQAIEAGSEEWLAIAAPVQAQLLREVGLGHSISETQVQGRPALSGLSQSTMNLHDQSSLLNLVKLNQTKFPGACMSTVDDEPMNLGQGTDLI